MLFQSSEEAKRKLVGQLHNLVRESVLDFAQNSLYEKIVYWLCDTLVLSYDPDLVPIIEMIADVIAAESTKRNP